jgi:hypothetical protein
VVENTRGEEKMAKLMFDVCDFTHCDFFLLGNSTVPYMEEYLYRKNVPGQNIFRKAVISTAS